MDTNLTHPVTIKTPVTCSIPKAQTGFHRDTGSTAVMEAEEDEPDTDAAYRSAAALKPKTLNEDPYNATWMKQYPLWIHGPASSKWPFDNPNGGHLTPEKVT